MGALRWAHGLDAGLIAEAMWGRVVEQENLPGAALAIFLLWVTFVAFSSVSFFLTYKYFY